MELPIRMMLGYQVFQLLTLIAIVCSMTGCLGRDYETAAINSELDSFDTQPSGANLESAKKKWEKYEPQAVDYFEITAANWSSQPRTFETYPNGMTTGPRGFGSYPEGFGTYPGGFGSYPQDFGSYPRGMMPRNFGTYSQQFHTFPFNTIPQGPNRQGFGTTPEGFAPRGFYPRPAARRWNANTTFPR